MPTQVSSLQDYRRLLSGRPVVVTEFGADWCEPSQALSRDFDALERQFQGVQFVRVNVDKAEELAANQRVRGLPTVTFHVDGQRLEHSTIQGAEAQRVQHTLTNLLRRCDYDSAPPKERQSVFQQAQQQQAQQQQPTKQPKQPTSAPLQPAQPAERRKRQVLFEKPHSIEQSAPASDGSNPVIEITSQQHYVDEVSAAANLVVIDFNATWCMPCKQAAPYFRRLAQTYGHVKFLSVDVDRCPDLAAAMEIKKLPTFMIGAQGAQKESFEGGDTAYLEERIRFWSVN